jgi:hypothetical protein
MTTNSEVLTEQEKRALKLISESERNIAAITARGLSDALGYASSKSGHDLIVSLEAKGLIRRLNRGQIEVL